MFTALLTYNKPFSGISPFNGVVQHVCIVKVSATLSLLFFAFAVGVQAQTGKVSLDPKQFLGKTISECEKILGKPGYTAGVGTGNYKDHGNMAQSRFYKAPSITRIVLVRRVDESIPAPNNDMDKQTLNDVVTSINYQIQKSKAKTWQEAFKTIGLSTVGVKEEHYPTKFVSLSNVPGGIFARWTPAGAPDGPSKNYYVKSKEFGVLSVSTRE